MSNARKVLYAWKGVERAIARPWGPRNALFRIFGPYSRKEPNDSQTFKIQRQGGVGDETLPVTHTCFFSIELPDYSTEEILKMRLLTAITYGVDGILNG